MAQIEDWQRRRRAVRFRSRMVRLVPLCAGALMLGALTLPGRAGPEELVGLDALAVFKLGSRAGVAALLGLYGLCVLPARRTKVVLSRLWPWPLLAAWALVSFLWSPLVAVTIGQAISLCIMLEVTCLTAYVVRRDSDVPRYLQTLALFMSGMSAALLLTHVAMPQFSGLLRISVEDGASAGLIHPTAAGALTGLAILLAAALRFQHPAWMPAWIFWPCLAVNAALHVVASSRTGTGATLAALFVLYFVAMPWSKIAKTVAVAGCLLLPLLVVDPGLRSLDVVFDKAETYVRRDESRQSLASFTGRTDLWEEVFDNWQESPLVGHGYFVTSRAGVIDAWQGAQNRSAHNVWLQALATIGIVGFSILCVALALSVRTAWLGLRETEGTRRTGRLAVAAALWFALWGLLDSSFLGPANPEPVTFYALLGLIVGQARSVAPPPRAESPSTPGLTTKAAHA